MKNKKTFLGIALLIAVLVVGIGYAAVTTTDLTINGTATAQDASSSFNVKFTDATPGTPITDSEDSQIVYASSTAAKVSDTVATMSVLLTNVGDSQTATFTVQNASQQGIKSTIKSSNVKIYKKGTTEAYSSDYFTVTTNIADDITIASGDSNTFTVTVELKKAAIDQEIAEEFDVVLEDIEAGQE